VGAGNLGLALADYPGFRDEGFEIVALMDTVREKDSGERSVPVFPSTTSASFASWCVANTSVSRSLPFRPKAAQAVVNMVVSAGVRGRAELFAWRTRRTA
jgi:NADH/NAD ratio-sensing transcriptional regulator Rex